jgi:hypothetical protein
MEALREFAVVTRKAYEAHVQAAKEAASSGDPEPTVADELRDTAQSLWDQAWADPADASIVDIDAIASRSGLPPGVVTSVIDLLSFDLVADTADDVATEFLNGRSPLRTRPILRDPDGSAMPVHEALLLPAVRDGLRKR